MGGCTLTRTGKIKGTPDVPSVQRVAFTKLSSLYSCLIDGWSQIVGEWFDCKDDVELRREFITGTIRERSGSIPPGASVSSLESDGESYELPVIVDGKDPDGNAMLEIKLNRVFRSSA